MANSHPKPTSGFLLVDFPHEHVILLTLNRPQARNAMHPDLEKDLEILLDWFEAEPSLWVAVITGAGKGFCSGVDLTAWDKMGSSNLQDDALKTKNGFGSISLRQFPKPIIAAVNGHALGGGMEIVLNCDLVVAYEGATFGLLEAQRGILAVQGVGDLERAAGRQLASEVLLLGRTVTAQEAYSRFGIVTTVVSNPSDVVPVALEFAEKITNASPDAIQATKLGLLMQKRGTLEKRLEWVATKEVGNVLSGENIKEGFKAFKEKRKPRWVNPAKL
ncbi:enoyl-CoA hydratase/carnithine racemase [Flagelloscypha sp. PMI_526]|nr:enoyl-CoA hydratase/carnithine racemase [Flagelloscypha sp. PMI_526]